MREEQFEAMHQEARGQTQEQQPGVEYAMKPEPIYDDPDYVGSGKLTGQSLKNRERCQSTGKCASDHRYRHCRIRSIEHSR